MIYIVVTIKMLITIYLPFCRGRLRAVSYFSGERLKAKGKWPITRGLKDMPREESKEDWTLPSSDHFLRVRARDMKSNWQSLHQSILGFHFRNETAMLLYKTGRKMLLKFCIIIESNSQTDFFRYCSLHQYNRRDVMWERRIPLLLQLGTNCCLRNRNIPKVHAKRHNTFNASSITVGSSLVNIYLTIACDSTINSKIHGALFKRL